MISVVTRIALAFTATAFLAACTVGRPDPLASAAPAPAPPATAAAAAPAPVSAEKVRSFEGIDEYRLGNGLRVLLFPDPTQSTVTVNITYLVGSMHEGSGETGMAHLLEHMLFKGSPKYRNVLKLLDERGAFANGTTWQDRTNYYETLPATAANLEWTLGLEADRMRHASISGDDLATEFSVVRNEMEAGENNPRSVLEQRVTASAFIWHNYGKDTIGSRSDVENVSTQRLRAFYDIYYQPDNAILVVAGKFDEAATLAAIEGAFGAIPRPARTLPPTYTIEPIQDGERSVTLRRPGDVHMAMALYHGVAGADPDHVAFDALDDLLTRKPSGRLYRKLVTPGVAAEVWGSHYLFRDPNYIVVGLKAKDGTTIDRARDAMLATIEGFAKNPVTAAEIDRFRATAQKELALALADSQRIAIELSEWAAVGDWRLLFAYRDRIKALTAADVQRVALAYLQSSNRTLGQFVPTAAPQRAPAPATPDVAAIVAGLQESKTVEGEAFEASLANLGRRTQFRDLQGGLHAAFLPKRTRGGKVYLQLRLYHGDVESLRGRAVAAGVLASVAVRGTKTRSYEEIQDEKDRLTANVVINGQPGWVTVRIETVRDSLPKVVELVADILQNPKLDATELAVVRQEAVSALEEQLQDPAELAFVRIGQRLAPWPKTDPRAVLDFTERIAALKKVTARDLREYHTEFWGAGHVYAAAVGDFDADLLAKQLESAFAGWTSKARYSRQVDEAHTVAPGEERIDTKDKEMAIITGGHSMPINDDHPDAAAVTLASHILGGSTGSRLWMRLREKDGFSYGVWGGLYPGDLDPVGRFVVGAILAPQNLAKGKAAILEELNRLIEEGVTADEVDAARRAWIEQSDNGFADDGNLVAAMRYDRFVGRDFAWHQSFRDRLAKVTADDVNRVIDTYLQPSKLALVEAGDLSKAK